jgi:hypothetical protein
LIKNDMPSARIEIANLIGELKGIPIMHEGKRSLQFVGKPKIDGVLGILPGDSTLKNSGGPLFHSLENIKPVVAHLRIVRSHPGQKFNKISVQNQNF